MSNVPHTSSMSTRDVLGVPRDPPTAALGIPGCAQCQCHLNRVVGHRVGSDPPGYPHSFPCRPGEWGVPLSPPCPPYRGGLGPFGVQPPLTPSLSSPGGGFAPAPRGAEDFSGEGFNLGNNDWALR